MAWFVSLAVQIQQYSNQNDIEQRKQQLLTLGKVEQVNLWLFFFIND